MMQRVFRFEEIKVLMRIFGPVTEEVTREWKKIM